MINAAMRRYWPQYRWANVLSMLKNMKKEPERCEERFDGRTVVITGASSGVGYRTARKYASMGARVIMVNRNAEKAGRVQAELERDFGIRVESVVADLSLLEGMRFAGSRLAALDGSLDVIIHNAGLHLEKRQLTSDGLETNFALHYLAPFVITGMLAPRLKEQGSGRIIFVGSEAYRFAVWGLDLGDLQWERRRYAGIKAYGAGKLAQLLSMHRFSRDLSGRGVTVNAMHPGMVKTETGKDNGRAYQWYKKQFIDSRSASPDLSAEALYWLGVSPALAGKTDAFFHLTTEEELAPPALDLEAADALWAETERLLDAKGGKP